MKRWFDREMIFWSVAFVLATGFAWMANSRAQQPQGVDPIFWCDISRSQVSHERDAALAQIEALKFRNASLDARVKELEVKAKEARPNE
jgi:hypothetical protein